MELLKRAEIWLRVRKNQIVSNSGKFFVSVSPKVYVNHWELLTKEELSVSLSKNIEVFDNHFAPSLDGEHSLWSHVNQRHVESLVIAGGKFIQDLCLPNMLHGRILKPPTRLHRIHKIGQILSKKDTWGY